MASKKWHFSDTQECSSLHLPDVNEQKLSGLQKKYAKYSRLEPIDSGSWPLSVWATSSTSHSNSKAQAEQHQHSEWYSTTTALNSTQQAPQPGSRLRELKNYKSHEPVLQRNIQTNKRRHLPTDATSSGVSTNNRFNRWSLDCSILQQLGSLYTDSSLLGFYAFIILN